MNPNDQLDALRLAYRQALPEKIAGLRAQWLQAAVTESEDDAQTFYRMIHSLAGTAGTFGLPEISAHARELENYVQNCREANTLLNESNAQHVNHFIQSLANQAHGLPAAAPQPPPADIAPAPVVTTILVTDDDNDSRAALVITLRAMGHTVLEARSGEEAIACFERERPAIVLMDVVMPGMTGYDATRKIKEMAGESFVPVIFLTAITGDQMLAKCVEVGGDNFLTKPYNAIILGAEIQALLRIRNLHRELELYKRANELEIQEAQHVFNAVFSRANQPLPNIQTWSVPATNFSGDTPLCRKTPDGRVHVMLADFTGHGLAPAVGTVLAAEIFHDLSSTGAAMDDILVYINNKFKMLLPTGRFCAAVLLAIEPAEGRVRVWNCGLPDVLMLDHASGALSRLRSTHVPLGVLQLQRAPMAAEFALNGNAFILHTDGIIESRNASDELFGLERLEHCVQELGTTVDAIIPAIESRVLSWIGRGERSDDLTAIVVKP